MTEPPASVKTIFDRAVEIAVPAERAAYLDRACDGNLEFRDRVETLLRASAGVGPFLERPAVDPASAAGPILDAVTAIHDPPFSPGSTIGCYKLLQPIGEGGMGTVFLAEQTEPVKRKVALKVIKPGMDSRHVVARFEAERQALAMMDHVNIARVFDGGTTENGRPYFVMELVHGVPITTYCDDNQLTPRERLELFVPVCHAIQHAHQKGIIHRDIKPSNVMVTLYDGKPVPKVIDFGVAKATEQKLTERTLFTQYGTVIGTLEYMSPEQAEMSALGVDTRSDIYSLGVLLYELLTGSTPLTHMRMKKAAFAEILRMIKEDEPPKPSTRLSESGVALASISAQRKTEPARLTKLVRGELDWIVMKTLEKDRGRRYETANGFAEDVRRYLADEPVRACPPSTGYRLRKFVRRNRGPVLGATLVLLALIAGLTGTTIGMSRARHYAETADLATREALGDKSKAIAAAVAEKSANEHAQDERRKAVESEKATVAALSRVEEAQRKADEALKEERFTAYTYRLALAHREWLADEVGRARQLLEECPVELRNWEWRYLRRLCNTELVAFKGHRSDVKGLAFSPDGSKIASAGAQTWVWDSATGKGSFKIPGAASNRVAFSPDGKRLARAEFQFVMIYDAADGKVLASLRAHNFQVNGIAFSPDGRRLATAGGTPLGQGRLNGGEVKIWDADSGKELHAFTDLPHTATAVAFSPDGKSVAAGTGALHILGGGEDPTQNFGKVRVWDAENGNPLRNLKGHTFWVTDVAFSPDSTRLATAGADGTVRVWDVKAGIESVTLRGHDGWVRAVAFSPQGNHLASAGDDRVVRVWDAVSGKEINSLRGHNRPVLSLAYSPDGRRLASGDGDRKAGEIRVWDATADQQAHTDREHTLGVTNVAFHGKYLAWSGWINALIRDLRTGRQWPGPMKSAKAVAFSPDGTVFAAVGYGENKGGVTLWDLATTAEVRHLPFSFNAYGSASLAYSPDGRRLAAMAESMLTMWDATTGRVLHKFRAHTLHDHDVIFSPDSRRFATSTWGGSRSQVVDGVSKSEKVGNEVKLWDTESCKELMTLPGGGLGLAFSPDGTRVASGSPDGIVMVWDVNDGKVLITLRGHVGSVPSVAFSPDGQRLVTAGQDQTIKIWDAEKGREILTLRGHGDPLEDIAFSPDGRYLASASGGLMKRGQVKLWDAGTVEPPPGR